MNSDSRRQRVRVTKSLDRRPQLFELNIPQPRTTHEHTFGRVPAAVALKNIPGDGRTKRRQCQVLKEVACLRIHVSVAAQAINREVVKAVEFLLLLLLHVRLAACADFGTTLAYLIMLHLKSGV